MKPTQPELPLENPDRREVTVYGNELPDAIAKLKADGFTCTIMECISNAGYRLHAWRTVVPGPDIQPKALWRL
jgi:hypothetical protein